MVFREDFFINLVAVFAFVLSGQSDTYLIFSSFLSLEFLSIARAFLCLLAAEV